MGAQVWTPHSVPPRRGGTHINGYMGNGAVPVMSPHIGGEVRPIFRGREFNTDDGCPNIQNSLFFFDLRK